MWRRFGVAADYGSGVSAARVCLRLNDGPMEVVSKWCGVVITRRKRPSHLLQGLQAYKESFCALANARLLQEHADTVMLHYSRLTPPCP